MSIGSQAAMAPVEVKPSSPSAHVPEKTSVMSP